MAYIATNLGFLPGGSGSQALGCSANGLVVVGESIDSDGNFQAVYWDAANTIHLLPNLAANIINQAFGCSSDGSVIVGVSMDIGGALHAVTWTGGPSWTINDLGFLSGGAASAANGCSANGLIIVGSSSATGTGSHSVPCVWVSGAPTALPLLTLGVAGAALAISSDGTIIAGFSNDVSVNQSPVSWAGGPSWAVTKLDTAVGGITPGVTNQAQACSANGATIVGIARISGADHAAYWNPTSLNDLGAGKIFGCDATATTIAGSKSATGAAYWLSGVESGLPLFTSAISVDLATAVSADASTIVGYGTDAGSNQTAVKWSSEAPPPSGPPLVWFRLNTGAWFPSGDPATVTGGISLAPLSGDPLFATVQGTGDAGMTLNAGATPFVGSVPAGYTGGLPHSGGGFTTLDPTKLHGSAGLNNSNHTASFITSPGVAQSVDGYSSGQYYFELTNPTGDIFSAFWGGGIGRNFNSGGDYNSWFNLGGFTSGDNNGGAIVSNETLGQPLATIGALNAIVTANAFAFPINDGDVIGVAVFISASPPSPPPPTPAVVIPVGLGRWRGQCGLNWNGLALVGDAFSNVVGLSDFSNFNEYGNQIQMLATAPPIHEDRKRIFITRFELEVEAGLGLPNTPQTAPQLTLDYSKNGGITFVPLQVFRSMGAAGEYIKRLRWINIGQSRTWVFRIRYSDPARPTIIGTYYDVWKGLG